MAEEALLIEKMKQDRGEHIVSLSGGMSGLSGFLGVQGGMDASAVKHYTSMVIKKPGPQQGGKSVKDDKRNIREPETA